MVVKRLFFETIKLGLLIFAVLALLYFAVNYLDIKGEKKTVEDMTTTIYQSLSGKTNKEISPTANSPEQFEYEIDTKQKFARILKYNGADIEVEIPGVIEGYPVLEIGNDAFRDNEYLSKVVFPNGLLKIGANAFAGCKSIETITLPSTLIFIDEYAFSNCTALVSIDKAQAVDGYEYYGLRGLNNGCFINCTNLTSVNLPGETYNSFIIGGEVFAECTNLQNIVLPKNLTGIGSDAFRKCESLTEFDFGDRIREIGSSSFLECKGITSVNLPGTIRNIYYGAFKECSSLNQITFGEYIETENDKDTMKRENKSFIPLTIDGEAFASTGLVNVEFPEYTHSIGSDVFAECKSLQTVKLMDTNRNLGEQSLGDRAFQNSTVSAVYLPGTLVKIGNIEFEANFTVYAPPQSVAYIFCQNNSIPVEIWEE